MASDSKISFPLSYAAISLLNKLLDISQRDYVEESHQRGAILNSDLRKEELVMAHGLRMQESLMSHEATKELEEIRHQYRVRESQLARDLVRDDQNSPFVDGTEKAGQLLRSKYERRKNPLLLIAPFYDDKYPDEVNYRGGLVNFETAFYDIARETHWLDGVEDCSGYLKRPLRHAGRDIDVIYSELANIPVFLVHGMIRGGRRVIPAITLWNLLPDKEDSYGLDLNPFHVKESQELLELEFQDEVARYLVKSVGILSDAYHLVRHGKRPNLRRYASQDEAELRVLTSLFSQHYDLLCVEDLTQAHFYRLEQAIMFQECGFAEEAKQSVDNSIKLWLAQRQAPQLEGVDPLEAMQLEAMQSALTIDEQRYIEKLKETLAALREKDSITQVDNLLNAIKDLKKAEQTTALAAPSPVLQPQEDELRSERRIDYSHLRDLLSRSEWRAANEETCRVMIYAVGRKEEGFIWFNSEELLKFPYEDLRTIDRLWLKYSDGKFGFSVQKKIYQECGARLDGNYPGDQIWNKFCDRVGWRWHYNVNDVNAPACVLPSFFLWRRIGFKGFNEVNHPVSQFFGVVHDFLFPLLSHRDL